MKISKRTLIMAVSLMLALTVTALGTVAYMTASDTVTNKFTVGNINIIVDEKNVDKDVAPDGTTPDRDQSNDYKLIPGLSQPKDPTVTVLAGSEECYVRMIVEMNCYDVLKAETGLEGEALLEKLVGGIDDNWVLVGISPEDPTEVITYEYRYNSVTDGEKVDASTKKRELQPLFNTITIPSTFDQDELETQMSSFVLNVTGQAVQTASFEVGGAEAAWQAYDAQMGNNIPPVTEPEDDTPSEDGTPSEDVNQDGSNEGGTPNAGGTPSEGDNTPTGNEGGDDPALQASLNDNVDDDVENPAE